MSSNFAFASAEWPDVAADCARAESYGHSDPRTSVFYARRALELLVNKLYDLRELTLPYRDDLAALIGDAGFQRTTGPVFVQKATLIRKAGNAAVHQQRPIGEETALRALEELYYLAVWAYFRFSATPDKTPKTARFDRSLVPVPAAAERQANPEELARLLADFAAKDAEIAEARAANANLQAQLDELRAQVAAAQATKTVLVDTHDYTEAQTRTDLIDLDLREAGWEPDDEHVREYPVVGMPAGDGSGYADYVLWGADGLPLAVVEAKRSSKDAGAGQQQAKLYADCLEQMTGRRPVIYFTNGHQLWLWDDAAGYPPRIVLGYHTRDQLELMVFRRSTRQALAGFPINHEIAGRHYQQHAIRRVGEEYTARRRRALLVMATGSGKTRTAIALVEQLMKAGWVKRVLFLADRVALVNQAVGAFKAHLPNATTVNLVTDKITDGRVFVSTYPTMTGLIDNLDESGQRVFGPGYFDLVIIDEAHRSIYAKYRGIFEWFDSLLIGLTATPKDEVDHNTYSLFGLEDGVPTDSYSLEDAVKEGYLVPPQAVSVPLKFLTRGVHYNELTEAEKDAWDAAEWNEDGVIPDAIDAAALNSYLFNADTVDKVLEVLMTRGYRVDGGDRIGKTIVFARNQDHARFISERFDANYPWLGGQSARVITHAISYAQSLIDDFSTPTKQPDIAISVDMLDTGIDIPEVCNLVFFKPVYSRTKFWQMIGRGTRLRPELFGPDADKTDFFVFDFCGNLEYFSQPDAGVEGSVSKPLSQRLFEARLALVASLDADQTEPALRDSVTADLHRIVLGMPQQNFLVRARREWVEKWSAPEHWKQLTPESAAEVAEFLADLPSAVRDDDELAKRFDLLVLQLQLATLNDDQPTIDRLRVKVQVIVANLLTKTTIPAVAAQSALLAQLDTDEWWVDLPLMMLESARLQLRGLVRFADKADRHVVYADFTDELGEVVGVVLPGVSIGINVERFRAKARDWLAKHDDLIALQKLRRNKQLTRVDLTSLENLLVEAGVGSREEVQLAAQQSHGLGLFVRSLVGLDRAAAAEAFAGYLHNANYTARQLDFLNLIIAHLTATGTMAPARLYESPFTDQAPTGPEYLFSDPEVDGIVVILDEIREHAVAVHA
ncbi:DEAD/DEAH box helicase family protein [Propionicimonas sp.]|uniref:DEAD/DEAH box helicase family protein n=1 Tax=Propionicimonas sp. TaxID=1955623 RepID=UPI0017CCB495|nr:DEAD/DEAH box helicase family protein [Propionicimonas sp.]MBU3976566.1 DEAD/DEAH box helicase family protein [Actinomycetota bacterium]MBA3020434.1 DUF4145 domain-containing protein [Propionicimonas sp.]MBU3986607.1 DEAD/DEAH box helicase family protein [Actinomycetota bacterium]MBU4007241.1 DEAD/DEAH box helicase family protein [Actinomycetota bacterium]MBU4064994.1 DEAD/DEAH box helicase family protein [Actinomycetota bacterium]